MVINPLVNFSRSVWPSGEQIDTPATFGLVVRDFQSYDVVVRINDVVDYCIKKQGRGILFNDFYVDKVGKIEYIVNGQSVGVRQLIPEPCGLALFASVAFIIRRLK
jgi:hypothetical protein